MNDNALIVNGLTKKYPGFILDYVSFTVPNGAIVGLIGENDGSNFPDALTAKKLNSVFRNI